MKFHIILRKEPEGGYTVFVPSLPGCISYGETLEEAHYMVQEAIEGYLLVQKDIQGDIIDDSSSVFDTIFVKSPVSLPVYAP